MKGKRIMKRTTKPPWIKETRLHDAICRTTDKNGFTQIPNPFIRDPIISCKAKVVLTILLSNKEGWTSHYENTLEKMSEGLTVLKSALKELERMDI